MYIIIVGGGIPGDNRRTSSSTIWQLSLLAKYHWPQLIGRVLNFKFFFFFCHIPHLQNLFYGHLITE